MLIQADEIIRSDNCTRFDRFCHAIINDDAPRSTCSARASSPAISAGAAGSFQMQSLGPKMAVGDFAPGFIMKHFIKDMKLSVEQGEAIGLTLPVLTQVLSECRSLEEAGLGDLGTQGLIRYYEK